MRPIFKNFLRRAISTTARARARPADEPRPSLQYPAALVFRVEEWGKVGPVQLQWPYIPPFEPEPKTKYSTINAKAETAATSRLWREPIRTHRCLIAVDGFFEPLASSTEKRKPQYYFTRHDREPFFFAGHWGRWTRGTESIDSCAIMTTDANPDVAPIHLRMPVIVRPEHYQLWLDTTVTDPQQLQPVYEPY